jgi:hypothetical protein
MTPIELEELLKNPELSAVLRRLINEVKNDKPYQKTSRQYDRIHNRHNR